MDVISSLFFPNIRAISAGPNPIEFNNWTAMVLLNSDRSFEYRFSNVSLINASSLLTKRSSLVSSAVESCCFGIGSPSFLSNPDSS